MVPTITDDLFQKSWPEDWDVDDFHNYMTLAIDDRIILIGDKKPFTSYLTAVVFQFTQRNATEILIKARGRLTARAIDVAEVVTKKFLNGKVYIEHVFIDSTEHIINDKKIRTSVIEIKLKQNGSISNTSESTKTKSNIFR